MCHRMMNFIADDLYTKLLYNIRELSNNMQKKGYITQNALFNSVLSAHAQLDRHRHYKSALSFKSKYE